MHLLAVILALLIGYALGWAICCFFVWLICLCFSWTFSLAIATGIYLIAVVVTLFIKGLK